MKVFIFVADWSDYDYQVSNNIGLIHEGDFDQFLSLFKSTLSGEAKARFNKVFLVERIERDFLNISGALNCKENTEWSISIYNWIDRKYRGDDYTELGIDDNMSYTLQCHYLGEKK